MHSEGRNMKSSISGKKKTTRGNKTVLKIITDRQRDKPEVNETDIQGKVVEHSELKAEKKKKKKCKKNHQQIATVEEASLVVTKLDVKSEPVIDKISKKSKLDGTQPETEEKLDVDDSKCDEDDLLQEASINQRGLLQPKKKRKKLPEDAKSTEENEIQNPELESAAENTDVVETHSTPIESGKKSKNKKKAPKNAEDVADKDSSKSSEEQAAKQKNFVLFLGNLPYDITEAEVEEHFKVVKGSIKRLTLLTNPKTGEGRGCGFLDLTSSKAYHDALKLNLSQLQDRKINVEFTVPGKKGSKRRSKYMKMKTKKLLGQRKKGKKKGHKMRNNAL